VALPKAPSSTPKVTAVATAESHGSAAAARQTAADVDAEVASERTALAAAYQSKREALQSAADVQAGLLLTTSATEYGATIGALGQREQAARAVFLVARSNVKITQAAQIALARNDATTSVNRLHEGAGGIGKQVNDTAHAEGVRMKAAASGSLARVQASGNTLSSEIATTPVNPRAITPDLDNDEDQAVLKAVGDSKHEARGAIAAAWNKANSDLNGTANENTTAFAASAAELGKKVNEKIPEAEQSIRDGGEATVGLIDAMARSQLGAIDSAERQTLAAIEQAKGQAVNILTAGKIAVTRLRSGVLGQTTRLVTQGGCRDP
jgi:hypothetical protein